MAQPQSKFSSATKINSESKCCSHCGYDLPLSQFYKKTSGYLGVDSKCKHCVLLSKSKRYHRLKRAKKGTIDLIDFPPQEIPEQAIALMLKHLGVR